MQETNKYTVIGYVLLLPFFLVCAACGNPVADSVAGEEKSTETMEMTETAENDNAEDWRTIYEREFDRISGYGELKYMGCYDISGDGVPELFLGPQSGENCQIFTIKEGQVRYVTFLGTSDLNTEESKTEVSFCDGQAVLTWENEYESGSFFAVMDKKQNAVVGNFDGCEPELFRLNGEYVEKEAFLKKFPAAEMLLAAKKMEKEADLQKENGADNISKTRENQTDVVENTEDWRALYEREIENLSGYGELEYQEYYDISGDGVPEMLLSADGLGIDIFTIEDGEVHYAAYVGITLSNHLGENDGCIAGMYLYEGQVVLECDGANGSAWSFAVLDEDENVTVGRFCIFYPELFWLNGEYVEKEIFLEKFPVAQMLLNDSEGETFYEYIKEYRAEKLVQGASGDVQTREADGVPFSLAEEKQMNALENAEDGIALYERKIEELSGYGELDYKWYYDISGDGVPELFLRFQSGGGLRVFTIEDGNVRYAAVLGASGSDEVYFDDGRVVTDTLEEEED